MKKLLDMINNLEVEVPQDEYIFVEYELFFNDDLGKYNRFSIDEEDANDLKSILDTLYADEDTILYVCSYGDEETDYKGDKFMYGDCICLDSNNFDIDYINQLFVDFRLIEPSDVSKLKGMDEYNQKHFYLFKSDGSIIDLRENRSQESFDNVMILYWD